MKRSFAPRAVVAASAVILALAACANAANETDTVKAELKKKFPGREVQSVQKTPLKGIYEVVMVPKQIVYTDAKGDYAFVGGDLVDINKKHSLTEARYAELNKTDFSKLPFELAMKTVRGDGSRKLAVFTDPDCPFCKKLEREGLKELDNVTIYYYLYPIPTLHPDAARKSALVWCSGEQQVQSWNKLMREDVQPAGDGKCDNNPIAKIDELAKKLDITATPTMVFESGEIAAGAMDSKMLEAKLAAKPKKQ